MLISHVVDNVVPSQRFLWIHLTYRCWDDEFIDVGTCCFFHVWNFIRAHMSIFVLSIMALWKIYLIFFFAVAFKPKEEWLLICVLEIRLAGMSLNCCFRSGYVCRYAVSYAKQFGSKTEFPCVRTANRCFFKLRNFSTKCGGWGEFHEGNVLLPPGTEKKRI